MILAFKSKAVRIICEEQEVAIDKFGTEISSALQDRLADLASANNLTDLIVGKPKRVVLEGVEGYRINLEQGHFLFFTSGHGKHPLDKQGNIDWNSITRVKILSINKEAHGK